MVAKTDFLSSNNELLYTIAVAGRGVNGEKLTGAITLEMLWQWWEDAVCKPNDLPLDKSTVLRRFARYQQALHELYDLERRRAEILARTSMLAAQFDLGPCEHCKARLQEYTTRLGIPETFKNEAEVLLREELLQIQELNATITPAHEEQQGDYDNDEDPHSGEPIDW